MPHRHVEPGCSIPNGISLYIDLQFILISITAFTGLFSLSPISTPYPSLVPCRHDPDTIMASATTPDHKPPHINTTQSRPIRRVHTLPAKLADETDGEPQITHLFEAGFAKVVAFQSIGRNKSGPASRSNSIGGEDLSERGTSQDGGN